MRRVLSLCGRYVKLLGFYATIDDGQAALFVCELRRKKIEVERYRHVRGSSSLIERSAGGRVHTSLQKHAGRVFISTFHGSKCAAEYAYGASMRRRVGAPTAQTRDYHPSRVGAGRCLLGDARSCSEDQSSPMVWPSSIHISEMTSSLTV